MRHRCPCTNPDVCGEEAKLISFMAKNGYLTPLGTGGDDALAALAAEQAAQKLQG